MHWNRVPESTDGPCRKVDYNLLALGDVRVICIRDLKAKPNTKHCREMCWLRGLHAVKATLLHAAKYFTLGTLPWLITLGKGGKVLLLYTGSTMSSTTAEPEESVRQLIHEIMALQVLRTRSALQGTRKAKGSEHNGEGINYNQREQKRMAHRHLCGELYYLLTLNPAVKQQKYFFIYSVFFTS